MRSAEESCGPFVFQNLIFLHPSFVQRGEGNDNPLQYSCLENPMYRGAWWLQSMGLQFCANLQNPEDSLTSQEELSFLMCFSRGCSCEIPPLACRLQDS